MFNCVINSLKLHFFSGSEEQTDFAQLLVGLNFSVNSFMQTKLFANFCLSSLQIHCDFCLSSFYLQSD